MIEFGFYIKTYWRDYHLAKALIASIRRCAPGYPIIIIPDDHYLKRKLWGEKVITPSDPVLLHLKGFYKKLWCFYGPFRRFIFLDADILVMKDLAELIKKIHSFNNPFFMCNGQSKFVRIQNDGKVLEWHNVVEKHIGNLKLISEFDSEIDMTAFYAFNSGCFASCNDLIPLNKLKSLFFSAQKFQISHGYPPLGYTRKGVFMSDQGFLNYILRKLQIPVTLIPDLYTWGGKRNEEIIENSSGEDHHLKGLFIHWAGEVRPHLLSRGVMAEKQWRRGYLEYYQKYGGWGMFLIDQIILIFQYIARRIRRIWAKYRKTALDRDLYGKNLKG